MLNNARLLPALLVLLTSSLQAQSVFENGFEQQPAFSVGGTSNDANVVLQLNQNPDYSLTQSGAFVFPTPVESGTAYQVNVISSPADKTCVVENASGIVGLSDIADIQVTCASNTTVYDIKQQNVSGLVALADIQVISCWYNRGYTLQVLPGDPTYSGSDYSGVFLPDPQANCGEPDTGPQANDRVNVIGTVSEFFGQIQLSDPIFSILGNDNPPPAAIVATTTDLATVGPAPLESVLVQVMNATVTDVSVAALPGDNDPTNEYVLNNQLHVDDLLFLTDPFPAINDIFTSIGGILTYRLGQSKLLPRYSSDAFIADPAALNLVINEVDYDQYQDDTAEFVELYNPTGQSISLLNKTLYFINGATHLEYLQIDLDSYGTLHSGQYLVIGSSQILDSFNNGSIEILLPEASGNLQNGPDGFVLIDRQTNAVQDALSYEGSVVAEINDLGGLNVNLVEGTATGATDLNNFSASLARIPNGVDSDNAQSDWLTVGAVTPGTANVNVKLDPSGLVLNEIDYDQPGEDVAEFIEILNTSDTAISLEPVYLHLVNGGTNPAMAYVGMSLGYYFDSIAPGQYLVISQAGVSVPSSALSMIFPFPDTTIQNGPPDGILLFDFRTSQAIDALSYEGSITAVDINGVSINLVEGTATPAEDSSTIEGSLIRTPNGEDTDTANDDWQFTTTLTPGEENPDQSPP